VNGYKAGKQHFGWCAGEHTTWLLIKTDQTAFTVDNKTPVVQLWFQEPTYRPWSLKIGVPAPTIDSAKDWIQDKAKIPKNRRI
jgi:hypothetical protein